MYERLKKNLKYCKFTHLQYYYKYVVRKFLKEKNKQFDYIEDESE